MKPGKSLSAWVLLVLCVAENAHSGNILAWYADGSHWINLKPVLETLVDRGHQVTVLIPSTSMYMDANTPSRFSYEPFNVSVSIKAFEEFVEMMLHFSIHEMEHMNYLQSHMRLMDIVKKNIDFKIKYLDGLLKSDDVMRRLKEAKYDVLLADPVYLGSELVAETFDIPLVYTLRFTPSHSLERLCGQLPAPTSYVPGPMSQLTDKMNFRERVYNFLFCVYQDTSIYSIFQDLDKYYTDFKGKPTTLCEMSGRADIWLMRTYWDFDFPRPFLPNFKFVGGIHCSPAKPLPEDMEKFVQSSGEAGVVVFTLGSIIKHIPEEKANMIALALAQIPQKVIWRFSGEKPKALGINTKIYPWIPQNDLLGHPKTRAFITHGGTNGIYEAIYHGVPMVGIPMFGDQPDNMVHMTAKGAALSLDINLMETQDLVNALKAVINEPSYKQRAMQLSQIHHDRPMSPRDEAVFWIEFTMRNRGAKHLRVQAHELTWYQYHSLDTAVFLLTVCLVLVLLFIKTCGFCIRKCCGRTGQRKSKAE